MGFSICPKKSKTRLSFPKQALYQAELRSGLNYLGFMLLLQPSPSHLQSDTDCRLPEVCFNGEEPQQLSLKNCRAIAVFESWAVP
jgi:hypothetical protein